jgi:hypothetical protein
LLFFTRGKALKIIEEGLIWKTCGMSQMPGADGFVPDGIFVSVPEFTSEDQLNQYIQALDVESWHALGNAYPGWVHLRGNSICSLPIDRIKAIIHAACPEARGIGLDVNPRTLAPGDIAGYRSIAVERLNFRMDSPYSVIDEPVRRARAMGGFASVEVCFSDELNGRAFLQAVDKALLASPNQVLFSDERSHSSFGTELLDKAGEMASAAGFKRVSLWAWAQTDRTFDSLGILLSGRSVNLGPDAVACWPHAYANPGFRRWLQTRLAGDFEVIQAGGKLENWLALASGLYCMDLHRNNLDCKMYRHVTTLERSGIIDKKGKPITSRAMEFCHKSARAARQVMLGGSRNEILTEEKPAEAAVASRKRG